MSMKTFETNKNFMTDVTQGCPVWTYKCTNS